MYHWQPYYPHTYAYHPMMPFQYVSPYQHPATSAAAHYWHQHAQYGYYAPSNNAAHGTQASASNYYHPPAGQAPDRNLPDFQQNSVQNEASHPQSRKDQKHRGKRRERPAKQKIGRNPVIYQVPMSSDGAYEEGRDSRTGQCSQMHWDVYGKDAGGGSR
ncbi:unnamed protein product [Cyclocybe aegerita]|uniref:Uncharacterized protein n=1 Tax=Cyclocybe aegerita TaxID=1973307 RepID=A0A8S0WCR2_CYCAE|nr:unnamed protein product [Cyclocybe aegerita]